MYQPLLVVVPWSTAAVRLTVFGAQGKQYLMLVSEAIMLVSYTLQF